MSHSGWTARDGAPTDITSLAQTSDGYLWIGTPLGLHRFDGEKFSEFPMTPADPKLPGREVSSLAADRKDGLWIGFTHGGISHLANRSVSNLALPKPYETAAVNGLYCCVRGSLWVLTGNTVLRWDGSVWENVGAKYGLPHASYFAMFLDRNTNIWAAARHHVYLLTPGAGRFLEINKPFFSITQFAEGPNGHIWVTNGWVAIKPLLLDCKTAVVPLHGTPAAVFDRNGYLWFAQDALGVGRMSHLEQPCKRQPTVEVFDDRDGLTANVTRSILMDRDGSIWVGTELGLDRFRPRSFAAVLDDRFKFYPALAAGRDGSIWAEAHGMPLQHMWNQITTQIGRRVGSSPIAVDLANRVWLLNPWDHNLHCIDSTRGTDTPFDVPAGLEDTAAQQIAALQNGTILLTFEGDGLWAFHGSWQRYTLNGLPEATPTALNEDGSHVWIGYDDNRLYQVDERTQKLHNRSSGLEVGTVLTTLIDHDLTWVAGTEGVAYAKGGQFNQLHLKDPTLTQGTSGIAYDQDRNLWLNSGKGVVRIPKRELELALQDKQHQAPATVYGEAEGILGRAAQSKPTPTLVKDKDGQLWIATSGHILQATPSLFNQVHPAPRVTVEAVKIDGRPTEFANARCFLLLPSRRPRQQA